MEIRSLGIEGAWEFTPRQFGDDRGLFLELFTAQAFRDTVGHDFTLGQANLSVSAAGVIRGIHFADVPPSQAKYVTCPAGAVLDVVVDIRVGSPTFGHWEAVLLDSVARRALYLSEGLGHAFCSLADNSTVTYFCSTPYAPAREHGVHPLDPELGIKWPTVDANGRPLTPVLSGKDGEAPTLAEAVQQGLLPTWEATQAYRAGLA
jgi:dTDP-4-dehydrorhamnose 3,5-epimerase